MRRTVEKRKESRKTPSLSPEKAKAKVSRRRRKKINDRHEICKVTPITVVGGTYILLNLKQHLTTITTTKVSLCVIASVK